MKRTLAGTLIAGALAAAATAPGAAAQPPPELRYELVSPLASRGFDFTRTWLFADGDHAIIGSELADVNGVYPVVRTADGWQQSGRRALTPPNGTPLVAAGAADVSADGSRVLVSAVRKDLADPSQMIVDRLAISEADGSWKLVGGGIRYVDGAPDLRRLVVHALWGTSDDERYPGLPGRGTGVFLWQDDGSYEGAVTAIAADAPRVVTCGAQVPDGSLARALEQTGVSPDARTVVLTSQPGCTDPDDGDAPLASHVFRWHDGVTTDLSAPVAGPDGDTTFVGGSTDLASVFLRSELPLDGSDANGAADLYRWDAATGARTRLTGAVTDGGDETLTTAISSDDGSHVWFATIDLAGAESLWVAARGGQPRRIATATEPAYPGQAAFSLRNDGLGSNAVGFPAQTTPDGETLLLTTRTPIDGAGGSTTGAGDDPGQLFRITAEGAVDCLSCLAGGAPADTVSAGGRYDGIMALNRVVSDDGRWIYFQTPTPLEPDDHNDRNDVYVWHDGVRSLLSGGVEGLRADLGNVDAHGNALFKSYAQLLPWIDDDHLKVYAARIDGGFSAPPDPRQGCVGDGCQGDPSARTPQPGNATETYSGPADADDPAPAFPADPSMRVGTLSAAARRALARGRAVTLTVRSDTAGRVTATARWKAGRRWRTADATARSVKAGGGVRLTLRLSRAARAQLARRGKLRLRVDVVHGQVAKPRRLAFVLKRQAPSRRGAHA